MEHLPRYSIFSGQPASLKPTSLGFNASILFHLSGHRFYLLINAHSDFVTVFGCLPLPLLLPFTLLSHSISSLAGVLFSSSNTACFLVSLGLKTCCYLKHAGSGILCCPLSSILLLVAA